MPKDNFGPKNISKFALPKARVEMTGHVVEIQENQAEHLTIIVKLWLYDKAVTNYLYR